MRTATAAFNGLAMVSLAIFSLEAIANPIVPSQVVEVPPDHTQDNLLTRWRMPVYPFSAFDKGITGEVTIEFDTDKHGGLKNVVVVDSKPIGVFDEAVKKTLSWWTVVPYRASHCFTTFPRTRITVSFGINKGMQTIVASKPIPLSDPLADRNLKLGPNGVGSIVGKKEPLVRFKKPPQVEYALENNRLYPIAGDVAARIKFNPDGRFGDIVVTFASPHPAFAEEVVRAAPPLEVETLDGGAPGVDVYVCLPLKFRPAP